MPKVKRALLKRLAKRLPRNKIQLNKGHRLVQLLREKDGQKYKTVVIVRAVKEAIFKGDIKKISGSVEELGRGWKRVQGIIYFSGPNQVRDSLL